MENEIENKSGTIHKLTDFLIKKKKIIISFFIIIVFFTAGIIYFNFYKEKQNKEISEKYIKAGILLSSEKQQKSKKIYLDIIESKNKFYSILALNNIIENDLETNSDEVLKLFNLVENIKINNDQRDLVKIKKALYLLKISKNKEANNLLEQIIADDSKWKNIALELKK